jgi:putative transposase
MANTYTQIYIQVVFAVQGRQNLILQSHKEEIHKYITGIIQNQKQKLIAINGMPDHLHVLIGLKPSVTLSDLVRDIKSDSSTFINERKWFSGRFNWQEGFGAFSYGHSQLGQVVKYIQNQEKHHQHRSFKEEYLSMLRKFEINFNEEYVFDWVSGDAF